MVQKVLLLYCTLAAVAYVSAVPVRNSYHPTKTIVDLAVATPDLSTLVTALKAGGLVDTLSSAGPFTVFAPTNEAFAALPKATLSHLLDPKNVKELQKLLTYHVVGGAAVFSKDITDNETIKTVEGENVIAHVTTAGIKINQAAITAADIAASNGVVHIIDSVINRMLAPPGGRHNGTAHACHAVLEGPTNPFGAGPLCIMRYVVDCEDITTRDMHFKPLDCRASGWPVCCVVQGYPTFGNFSYDFFPRWYKAGKKCSDITRTSPWTVPFTPC